MIQLRELTITKWDTKRTLYHTPKGQINHMEETIKHRAASLNQVEGISMVIIEIVVEITTTVGIITKTTTIIQMGTIVIITTEEVETNQMGTGRILNHAPPLTQMENQSFRKTLTNKLKISYTCFFDPVINTLFIHKI